MKNNKRLGDTLGVEPNKTNVPHETKGDASEENYSIENATASPARMGPEILKTMVDTNIVKAKVQRSTADVLKRFSLFIETIQNCKIAKPEEITQLKQLNKTFKERWIGLDIEENNIEQNDKD